MPVGKVSSVFLVNQVEPTYNGEISQSTKEPPLGKEHRMPMEDKEVNLEEFGNDDGLLIELLMVSESFLMS